MENLAKTFLHTFYEEYSSEYVLINTYLATKIARLILSNQCLPLSSFNKKNLQQKP